MAARLRRRHGRLSSDAPPLLILQLESPSRGGQGDSVYRTLQPCRALGELPGVSVVSGSLLSPALHELAARADVLIACDVVDADLLPVFAARRAAGLLTVYEINDDFLAAQPWSQASNLAGNLVARSVSSLLARAADRIQVTCPTLAQRYRHLTTDDPIVLPNQLWSLPEPAVFTAAKAPAAADARGERVRVGWGGSLGHADDLRFAMPALERVLRARPSVTLDIMGPTALRSLFDWAQAGRVSFTPGGSLDDYYRFLLPLHIGLAPLLPTDFNRCRSDVKWLEYAAHGVVPVLSELEPYADASSPESGAAVFRSLDELEATLLRLIDSPDERAARVAAGLRACAGRVERAHAGRRLDLYRELIAQAARRGPARSRPRQGTGLPSSLAAIPRPFAGSAYHLAGQGPTESALYDGLAAMRAGRTDEARACFAAAAVAAPSFYLPHLYAGALSGGVDASVAALGRALERAPESPNAWLALGGALERGGLRAEARVAFERCAAAAPTLGAARERLGELAVTDGHLDEAVRHWEAACDANPFLGSAAARLALVALDAGAPGPALDRLEAALAVDDRLWLTHFLRGRALVALGRDHEAIAPLERALGDSDDKVAVLAQLAKARLRLGDEVRARALVDEIKRLRAAA